MPVRIYDIAKKLGIESKEVLAKARALGITGAKVPSSSLDKITAEYLEIELGGPRVVAPPPAPPPPPEPVLIVAPPPQAPPEPPAPVAPPEPVAVSEVTPAPPPVEIPVAPPVEVLPPPPGVAEPPVAEPEPVVVEAKVEAPEPVPQEPVGEEPVPPAPELEAPAITPEPPVAAPPPGPPPPPPPPPPPRIGDKVGFIKLPVRPVPRAPERPAPPRPVAPARTGRPEMRTRFEGREARPAQANRFGQAGARPGMAGRGEPAKPAAPAEPKFVPPATGELITLKPPIIVRDLAEQLKKKPFQLIADLMQLNVFASVNQAIDESVAQRLCARYGFRFEVEKRERGGGVVHAPVKKVALDVDDNPEDMELRAPVVTIMGHVDHGKTTLLDVIRKSNVAAGEAGGITQHIGAYTISIPHPERPDELQQITFLDTPGHAAFSSMRARGANVTDIVILVVASDDGVMPQTVEALSHAQAAKVPILVAVNKCDHPAANPMRVRQQLQDKGLVPDDWGGDTIFVDVSALTKQGVDKLLEMLVLQAELLELKANPNRRAKGNVIESGLEPGGPTATVLVRKGTLHVGDIVICGQYWGRVRALINEEGKRLKEAGPSVAVKLLGLNGVPEAGLEFSAVDNEKNARLLGEERAEAARHLDKERRPKVTLENLFDTLASESSKVLRVVVKADTQGSVEAIVDALKKIESTKVSLEVIHSAVGTITESDVLLASASEAIILGFHTRIDNGVAEVAKREGVQIKLYAIIYELVDQVKEAMAGLLDPLLREVVVGSAEVRKVFTLSKGGNVAGCAVSHGRIVKGKVRVMRRKSLVYEGLTQSLRRFQDEVNEVRAGMECGIRLDGFDDFQVGDAIECYTLEKIPQKL
ncbi:MAG: translation initiation factor IF-2 [Verrucomicrobiia bacterium]